MELVLLSVGPLPLLGEGLASCDRLTPGDEPVMGDLVPPIGLFFGARVVEGTSPNGSI